MRLGLRPILCIVAMLAFSGPVNAQVLYGALTGNVTDPTGAPIPGAHVEAVNQETNVKTETDTDVHGVYRFTDVQAGVYRVTFSSKSFRTVVENNVQVQVSTVRRVDVQLTISAATESVQVSADSVVLQTDKADIHAEISTAEVEN